MTGSVLTKESPKAVYLKDYTPPEFLISTTELFFELSLDTVRVTNRMQMHQSLPGIRALSLVGEGLELLELNFNGQRLTSDQYHCDAEILTIHGVPEQFTLEIKTAFNPQDNLALEGLYASGNALCTQCEPEGFRKITYYLDRPDVLSRFTTHITYDPNIFPYALSNGNRVNQKDLSDGRRIVTWQDPFPKPCYLFALVAGDFDVLCDEFITADKRTVALEFYVSKGFGESSRFAMECLKSAMKWDEQRFGRIYDLDIYMVVAVFDFNMGAMENKGLNIFNSKFVLVDQDTAEDIDFMMVDSVIAHEYLHNWSGNRVTCRDWFQLSLKEGLTVFRDQEYSSDHYSRAIQRISDARDIRTRQFAEDLGPHAHPVRPDHYLEINNFYTSTVYEKGAEVIRMLFSSMGKENFRKALDNYFERYDGTAATIEDFLSCMAPYFKGSMNDFMRWYHQKGTPTVKVSDHYDPKTKEYRLTFSQEDPFASEKDKPFVWSIPIDFSRLDAPHAAPQRFWLNQPTQTCVVPNCSQKPIPSLLRSFSAPVMLQYDYTPEALQQLAVKDDDAWIRWDALHQLLVRAYGAFLSHQEDEAVRYQTLWLNAIASLLHDAASRDPYELSLYLELPDQEELMTLYTPFDPLRCAQMEEQLRSAIYHTLGDALRAEYQRTLRASQGRVEGTWDRERMGIRALKNRILGYLMWRPEVPEWQWGLEQYHQAESMNDKQQAFYALLQHDHTQRQTVLDDFYRRYQHHPLLMDKWFGGQATARSVNVLPHIRPLMQHADFHWKNPNRVRSLLLRWALFNPAQFHSPEGYDVLIGAIERVDAENGQLASRLLSPFLKMRFYSEPFASQIKTRLQQLQKRSASPNVTELLEKTLNQ